MTYIACPDCGHKALNIATRCPQCGHPFESRLWQSPAPGTRGVRIPKGLIIAGVAIVLVAVGVVQREGRRTAGTPLPPSPTSPTDIVPGPTPPSPATATQPADSVALLDSVPPRDSVAP